MKLLIFLKLFLFLSISTFSLGDSCPIPKDYEISAENSKFQLINYRIDVKDGKGRNYEGTLAMTKPGNDRSWFKILSLIKKPVVDTPPSTLK